MLSLDRMWCLSLTRTIIDKLNLPCYLLLITHRRKVLIGMVLIPVLHMLYTAATGDFVSFEYCNCKFVGGSYFVLVCSYLEFVCLVGIKVGSSERSGQLRISSSSHSSHLRPS
jgi:hypothetical protein